MNPPTRGTRLTGHPAVVLGLVCMTLVTIYAWWSSGGSNPVWFIPLGFALITGKAVDANRQVLDYKRWKIEWELMHGADPYEAYQRKQKRLTALVLSIGLWLCLGYWLATQGAHAHPDDVMIVAVVFAIASLALLVRLIQWARKRRALAPAKPKDTPDHVVAVALPLPKHSPKIAQLVPQLPDYARTLLARTTPEP
jgi:hypothetical protein